MNLGIKAYADSYRRHGEIRKAEIYDFLATCDNNDICDMFDSSVFNDIVKGYVKMALMGAELNEKDTENVLDELRYLFDTVEANKL